MTPTPLRRKRHAAASGLVVGAAAADRGAWTATPSRAGPPPGARRRRARRRRGRGRPPPPPRRCWRGGAGPASPVSAADTANRRCSSAITGRMTDRFSLSECTSPSSRSNSSQPIHIAGLARRRRRRGCAVSARSPSCEQLVGGLPGQLPGAVGSRVNSIGNVKSPACGLRGLEGDHGATTLPGGP